MHCFKHKRIRKILTKKGEGGTKKIEFNRKWLWQKEEWKNLRDNDCDKKKNEKVWSKSSIVMVMNDSIGKNIQDTLNPKPKDYLKSKVNTWLCKTNSSLVPDRTRDLQGQWLLSFGFKLRFSTCKWV
jgi:hypothetical protein